MSQIAILFARADSIYKSLPGCDVWDVTRDAKKWNGGCAVVAHPPCRAWGRLRSFSRPSPGEKELALWTVHQVRKFGGVLEHPKGSQLWNAGMGMPMPGEIDYFGGWTLPILQFWFGHRAEKATWLYIVGCKPEEIPSIPLILGEPTHVVQTKKMHHRPHITKAEREHTPLNLAVWLCELARRTKVVS
jgi:hypothetical protein